MHATLKITSLTLLLLGPGLTLAAQEQTPPGTPAPATSTQATPAPAPVTPPLFANDRLEQLAAPIALYPDALVAQILMASTYPLEIVEAARWVEKNPELKGAALEEGLKQNEWDPSVKALCGFPTVLKQMNDNLAWTKDLGDAFLAQKVELMDTIQEMRRKALDAGTLKTTEQQSVAQDDGKIVIEPANPEVIYVPSYSPALVYGPAWYYPTWYYPGWYDPWPWGIGISFGIGFFWGFGCWGGCDWHHHCCNVHCGGFNTFNARTSVHGTNGNFTTAAGATATWQHDPAHRAGVGYRSPQVAHEFGAAPGSTRVANSQARGFEHASPLSGTRGAPPAQRSGAGPASGRMTGDPSFRGSPRTYSGSPPSSRGRGFTGGGMNGFRSPSPRSYSGGWGGASRGGTPTFGRGGHSSGSFGGGRSWGGSFGGRSGGRGFGGGGFHGGGRR
jgi:hypothetical protein